MLELVAVLVIMVLATFVVACLLPTAWRSRPRVNKLTLLGIQIGLWLVVFGFVGLYLLANYNGNALKGYVVPVSVQTDCVIALLACIALGLAAIALSVFVRGQWDVRRRLERDHHSKTQLAMVEIPRS